MTAQLIPDLQRPFEVDPVADLALPQRGLVQRLRRHVGQKPAAAVMRAFLHHRQANARTGDGGADIHRIGRVVAGDLQPQIVAATIRRHDFAKRGYDTCEHRRILNGSASFKRDSDRSQG